MGRASLNLEDPESQSHRALHQAVKSDGPEARLKSGVLPGESGLVHSWHSQCLAESKVGMPGLAGVSLSTWAGS